MAFTSKYLDKIYRKFDHHPEIFVITIFILLPFALFLNLRLMPLISDEPTRGIVTLEMIISDNYITPTINGIFYYNKPPLYNWILATFVRVFGSADEFILRLPTVISLILIGLTTYFLSQKTLNKLNSLLVAFMFVTSARILFWDSFQGLIDITYSLVTLCTFAALYHFSTKKKFLLMFLATYILTSIGFLLKGLPSLAFQAISLIVWLAHEKKIRMLFTWKHLLGIALFIIITGSYYIVYLQSNSLQNVFLTLVSESNRLNEENGSILTWLSNLFTFPIEMIYHFAPWTLLLLLLFDKRIRQKIYSDKFIKFCLLIFISNIIIYWISANMRPRYIFMLYPLLLMILVKAYTESRKLNSPLFKFSNIVFLIIGFLGALSIPLYLIWEETNQMHGIWIIVPLLFIIAFGSALFSIKLVNFRIHFLIIILLIIRIAFNLYNLQARYNGYPDAGYRQGEITAGQLTKGQNLYILGDTPFNHDASFYITRERMQIITRVYQIQDEPTFYITDSKNLDDFTKRLGKFKIYEQFTIKLKETKLYLIKSE